jgi:hypothetical protein
MPTFILDDESSEVWLESFAVDATGLGLGTGFPWST